MEKEKGKLKTLQSKVGHGSSSADNPRSVFVDFPVNSKFVLHEEKAAYGLSVEIQVHHNLPLYDLCGSRALSNVTCYA